MTTVVCKMMPSLTPSYRSKKYSIKIYNCLSNQTKKYLSMFNKCSALQQVLYYNSNFLMPFAKASEILTSLFNRGFLHFALQIQTNL